jgi:hypothetical protein
MVNELTEKQERQFPEQRDSLWWVASAPGIWGAHFLLSYGTAAVWCAKNGHDAPLSYARGAIYVYTALALAAIGVVALRGWRRYRAPGSEPRTDADSSESRHRFLGFTLLSLAGLSAVAILFQGLAAVFIGSCR